MESQASHPIRLLLPSGELIELTSTVVVIGSGDQCDVQLSNVAGIQPQHLTLSCVSGRWLCESQGNWTFCIAGGRPTQREWLHAGTEVLLSKPDLAVIFEPSESQLAHAKLLAIDDSKVPTSAKTTEAAEPTSTFSPPPIPPKKKQEPPPIPSRKRDTSMSPQTETVVPPIPVRRKRREPPVDEDISGPQDVESKAKSKIIWSGILLIGLCIIGAMYLRGRRPDFSKGPAGEPIQKREIVDSESGKPATESGFMNRSGSFVLHGVRTLWFKRPNTGTSGLKFSEEEWVNGLLDGTLVSWDQNGHKRLERHFRQGKEDGEHLIYFPSGQKQSEFSWTDGKRDGIFRSWFDDGQQAQEGLYKEGQRIGTWREWRRDGTSYVMTETDYDKDNYGAVSGLPDTLQVETSSTTAEYNIIIDSNYLRHYRSGWAQARVLEQYPLEWREEQMPRFLGMLYDAQRCRDDSIESYRYVKKHADPKSAAGYEEQWRANAACLYFGYYDGLRAGLKKYGANIP